METIYLLEFLNNATVLHAPDYAMCAGGLVNFLDLMSGDDEFTRKIDFGMMFVHEKDNGHYILIDGLKRILSLSLLLHAICECYKKTTPQNDKAINRIRKKYLLSGTKTKLRLPENEQVIFEKIIYGERLSGKEKKSPIFVLLHDFWAQIKEEKLQAAKIFDALEKFYINVVETEEVSRRDIYYSLNKDKPELNQLLLIEDYIKSIGIKDNWDKLKKVYDYKEADIIKFLKDFFITKFNFKEFDEKRLYETFINYCDTMLQYMPKSTLIDKILNSAIIYHDIMNIDFENENIQSAMIKIKMHEGEDTYAYLLSIFEDYLDNNITEGTFLEILSTIDEYLVNRQKTPNNVSFNELVTYLNTFIACK